MTKSWTLQICIFKIFQQFFILNFLLFTFLRFELFQEVCNIQSSGVFCDKKFCCFFIIDIVAKKLAIVDRNQTQTR